ncbi:MAG: DNA polymerase III subunit alpha, partial [Candidatus Atribacteria bacterium]|nr:DNA polymerase III subunit alpha [Candidatus Atribacteria bacterium]
LKSPEEMERDFSYCPQALENTSLIAERCQVNLELGKVNLPHFPVPPGFDAPGYLRSLCLEGLVKRYGDPPPERARKQLEYELKVIEEMGYSTYFLIVWDFVNFARRKGIMVGPGRGSAAGSIVSYALGITSIDPLQYGLLFERFLNPERVSMPDIDIDFCFERRGEVIEYVAEKYGKTNVAQIITFGRMMARQAVRDVGRALGWSYGEVDKIAKLIPGGPGVTLKKALESNSQLRDLAKQNKELQRLLEIASRIEGMCRHASVHAAGVVISNQPLTNYVPLQKMSEGEVVTQLEMDALQELGLLKMDFLGLRTLTVIEKALQIIKNTHHEEIDLDKIPLNDEETFSLLSRGETTGVFQLESGGMKELLKRLNPSNIEDLTAILALYRPGPLGSGMIEDFINRKHGKVKIEYPHPALEPILRETYGVIVYQEQVMRIAAELAGFTLGEADILRRAMGKKQPEVMKEQRTKFVEGALKRGCSKEKAEEIFDLIEYFAGYGFNKSHSAAYALISYQTAYLKAHYPTEYLAACLTSVANDNEKVAKFIGECKKLGIQVLLPDINESLANFTVVGKNKIRFGLSAIKNVGSSAVEEILTRRKEGKFSNIFDFVERVDSRVINKRVLESLVEAGAFDELHPNRAQLLASLEDISLLSRRKKSKKKQKSLFGEENNNGENFSLREAEELPREELLRMEKEMLGLYISDNPLNVGFASSVATVPLGQISNLKQEVKVRIRGIVNKSKKITTKNGGDMYFVTLEDETGSVEVVFFPKLAQQLEEHLSRKQVIWIIGKVDLQDNGEYKIIAEELIDIEEKKNLSTVHIEIPEEKDTLKTVYFLKDYLRRFPGSFPVVLHLRGEKESWAVELGESFCIDWNEKVENLIKDSLEGGEVWLAG